MNALPKTPQDLFAFIFNFRVAQGRPSAVLGCNEKVHFFYFNRDGAKSALGCLLPREMVVVFSDYQNRRAPTIRALALRLSRAAQTYNPLCAYLMEHETLLSHIQTCDDFATFRHFERGVDFVTTFKSKMTSLAARHGFTAPCS